MLLCRYERKGHLQLVLGIPGVGMSTLIKNLRPLILDRLDKEPEWLMEHTGFRECLRSSLEADIPYIFVLVCTTLVLSILVASGMIDRRIDVQCPLWRIFLFEIV